MKLKIESTPITTQIDGVPVRLWHGVTECGVPCKVFVHRLLVALEQDQALFERELADMGPSENWRELERAIEASQLQLAQAQLTSLVFEVEARVRAERERIVAWVEAEARRFAERPDVAHDEAEAVAVLGGVLADGIRALEHHG
ncbi:MAG: hypothetical protein M9894_16235 [Planctomycetes bacterium]|nr:hypothetical protein [Planctomycetota bacterium]